MALEEELPLCWQNALIPFIERDGGRAILDDLENRLNRDENRYYPTRANIFAAFHKTHFNNVRVVIIGQDPYPNGNATGIAFFANGNSTSSLDNINVAIRNDLDGILTNNCLLRWAEDEGVLLLNSVPTVRRVMGINTHKGEAWETFMGAVLKSLVNDERILQFMLWGNGAKELQKYIRGKCYHIHTAPHPTSQDEYLEAFENCRHFSTVNDIFEKKGESPINWLP